MIDRRAFLTTMGAGIVAAPVTGAAQPATDVDRRGNAKLPVIGYLGSGFPSDRSSSLFAYLFASFADGLRQLGYVDGQTVTTEWRWAEQQYGRLPDLAADLVRLDVDVIFTPSDHSAVAARQATHTTPIVFLGAVDPVNSGFAVSLARPGSNMTGLTLPGPEITGKRLGLLKEAVPSVSRVAILRNPRQTSDLRYLPAAQDSARALGLSSQVFEVRGPDEWDKAFSAMARDRAHAVLVLPDTTFYIGRERLAELARRHRLPLMGHRAESAQAGALMAYGTSLSAEWRRAGVLVGKILKGAKPADLPIEQPMHFEFVINLKTAKSLGLTIPESLLLRADQVIE
jgi:putative ABC transport system substrate-binding protein